VGPLLLGVVIGLLGTVAVVYFAGDSVLEAVLYEIIPLGLGIVPVMFATSCLEQLAFALLARANGFRVTSLGCGEDRPLWWYDLGGVRLYLCRQRPLRVMASVFAPALLVTRGRLVRLAAGLVLVHVLAVAAALACVYFCPWGRLVAAWAALLNTFAALLHARNLPRWWRHGTPDQPLPARVRQNKATGRRLQAVGDTVGLYINLLDGAFFWVALGNADYAEHLRARAAELPVHGDAQFPLLAAVGALGRARTAWARGLWAESGAALDEARRSFEAQRHEPGLFLTEWTHGLLLVSQGEARQGLAVLDALAGSPLPAERPAVRAELLAARVWAAAALPDAGPLADRLLLYEACRHEHPLPWSALDLRVYRAVMQCYERQGDQAAAEAACRKVLAAFRKLRAGFGKDASARARFEEAHGSLARDCLHRLGQTEDESLLPER
jgi:hypothetical protein